MDTTSFDSDLKERRGFGLTDPVPLFSLDPRETAVRRIGAFDRLDEQEVLRGDKVIGCPRERQELPTSACWTCQYFVGIGAVTIRGEAPTEERFRVVCRHPRERPVVPGPSVEVEEQYLLRLKIEIEKARRPNAAQELDVFVKMPSALNCPMARAKTGRWKVTRPPCPACPDYRGLKAESAGPIVVCGHAVVRKFRKVIPGSSVLPEQEPDAEE